MFSTLESDMESSSRSSSPMSIVSRSFDTPPDALGNESEMQETLVEDMEIQVRRVDDIYDETSGRRAFVDYDPDKRPTAKVEVLSSERYSKWILVIRRVFEQDNKTLFETKLDIRSPLILDILQDTVKEEQATLVSTGAIKWPNDEVFRYRKRIQDAAVKKGELAVKHVEVLLELIDTEYATRLKDIDAMFPKGTSSFKILREAFQPDDIIVDSRLDNPRSYRVISAYYEEEDSFSKPTSFTIQEYTGIEYLNTLEVFPLKYHPNKDAVEKVLVDRGRKFAALKGRHHKIYKEPVHPLNSYQRDDIYTPQSSDEPLEISSEVIIDTATFNRFNPSYLIRVTHNIGDELTNGELTDRHLMICTDQIPFFSLKTRQFHRGNISNIDDKIFDQDVFSRLVLPGPTKQLIRVLVENHSKGRNFDDFIKGKGQGLVLLLHGPPGVGKTMTAEAVAEYTRRPLYIATSGELGATPKELEAALKRVLDISNAFGAALLLDEADIFLEQRTLSDLQRNALVSIFLRLLEYYKGILFLTTNRVETFDHAFHSRIHITLGYSTHDFQTREQIWRNFGAHMTGTMDIEDEHYKELSSWELNGRQIKNALSLASALAAERGGPIIMEDLRTVLGISTASSLQKLT
ncbi:P-loop containing nucleoside triphosphate hydrolase protein [Xylogone sp. PMI_703]|nr:P-loop containing nucleoside triphosphate hydrolase protein [Xylogone sp. PMI_703]